MKHALWFLLVLGCSSSQPPTDNQKLIDGKLTSKVLTTLNESELSKVFEKISPDLLRVFRPRMNLLETNSKLSRKGAAFLVELNLRYGSLMHQRSHTAKLLFEVSLLGKVSACRIQDPFPEASEVSCERFQEKLEILLVPSFSR
jgi:hypothetical protein